MSQQIYCLKIVIAEPDKHDAYDEYLETPSVAFSSRDKALLYAVERMAEQADEFDELESEPDEQSLPGLEDKVERVSIQGLSNEANAFWDEPENENHAFCREYLGEMYVIAPMMLNPED